MQVFRHVNSVFASNTYLIADISSADVYAIDPGSDSEAILEWLTTEGKTLAAILLTHAHHDHIYGINELIKCFPTAKIHVTEKMINGLLSARENMSEYLQNPWTICAPYLDNLEVLVESSSLVFWNRIRVNILHTPGHTEDSITYQIANYVFSGDSLIPGLRIVYRKKSGGDALKSIASIKRIQDSFSGESILLPGHGRECTLTEAARLTEFRPLISHAGFGIV
ncbi:MAG: MBL fold metallo-hydrolase [Verrucomicrobia bacterium]|nr:MBL fold metallo-hydrolase [Verrucomicrobiota bacterium]